MRKNQKPHRSRKPFKRKTGGPRFMLEKSGGSMAMFDIPSKKQPFNLSTLIRSILLGGRR